MSVAEKDVWKGPMPLNVCASVSACNRMRCGGSSKSVRDGSQPAHLEALDVVRERHAAEVSLSTGSTRLNHTPHASASALLCVVSALM